MPFRPKNSRYWHYDFQIRGCRFHGSCDTEDFEQAKAVEAQARVNAKTLAKAPAGIFTLSEAIGTYFNDVCQYQPSAFSLASTSGRPKRSSNPAAIGPGMVKMASSRRPQLRRLWRDMLTRWLALQ